jgi:hypothetical protein
MIDRIGELAEAVRAATARPGQAPAVVNVSAVMPLPGKQIYEIERDARGHIIRATRNPKEG